MRLNKFVGVTVVNLALLVGVGLTIWGLLHLTWQQAVPWSIAGLRNLIIFFVACTILVIAGAFWSKRNPLAISAVVAVCLALITGALWPLLVTLWFGFASILLGNWLLSSLKINVEENWLINFLVGAGAYGTVIGLLAHFPVNYSGLYGVALAVPLLIWRRTASGYLSRFIVIFTERNKASPLNKILDGVIGVIVLIYFAVALMPELGHDALAMHLFIPAHMSLRHHWAFDAETYVWAVMPTLGDWIFTICYVMAGEAAARLINISFIFVLGWLVRDLVLWAGGSTLYARWASLIFLSTPLTFTEGSKLFIESVWTGFIVTAIFALLRLSNSFGKSKQWIALAALLIGFAAATKAVTLVLLPLFTLLIVLHSKSLFKTLNISFWLTTISLFLLIGIIPYLTAYWLTGNPVFPFFNGIFKSPFYPPVNFDAPSIFEKGMTFDIFYHITFNSHKYLEAGPGASGFQLLLFFFPLTLIVILSKEIKALTLSLTGLLIILAVFQSTAYLRYVFPAFVLFSAFIGSGLSILESINSNRFLRVFVLLNVFSSVLLNILFLSAGAMHRDFPIQSIWSNANRDLYLQERLPIRNAIDLVNKLNSDLTPVAIFGQPLTAGIQSDVLYSNWYNFKFQGEVNAAKNEQDLAKIFRRRGVIFIVLDFNWTGSPEKKELIKKLSDSIAEIGSINVRKVKSEYRYKDELLNNSEFFFTDGWSLTSGAEYDNVSKTIIANVLTPVTQSVAVSPGQRYLNSVVARCYKETTMGRVQINWIDAKGKFISAAIKTFECTSAWTEHQLEVIAPPLAAQGISFVSGHTTIPIQFKSNSLKQ